MYTNTFILDAINHDESLPSPILVKNVYIISALF